MFLGLAFLPLQQGLAQREDKIFGRHWGAYITLHHPSWDGLGDVQPIGRGGSFKTTGTGIEFGGYASVARMSSVWVLAGMKMGLAGFNDDVIFESDPKAESALQLNHIGGEMRFRFGQPGSRYVDVDLGVGSYVADSKYIDCSVITSCFAADTSSNAAGVYLGLTGMVGRGVLVGARVHNVDFDPIEAIDLGLRPLEGPVYTLFVGWEFGSWRRD